MKHAILLIVTVTALFAIAMSITQAQFVNFPGNAGGGTSGAITSINEATSDVLDFTIAGTTSKIVTVSVTKSDSTHDGYVASADFLAFLTGANTASSVSTSYNTHTHGTAANLSDYPGSLFISENGNTGHTYAGTIGVIGEATSDGITTSTGVGGVASTSGALAGRGVSGVGKVAASADTGKSIGGHFRALDAHVGDSNIGVYANAQNGATNYSFYGENGDIFNNGAITASGMISAGSVSTPTINANTLDGVTSINYLSFPPQPTCPSGKDGAEGYVLTTDGFGTSCWRAPSLGTQTFYAACKEGDGCSAGVLVYTSPIGDPDSRELGMIYYLDASNEYRSQMLGVTTSGSGGYEEDVVVKYAGSQSVSADSASVFAVGDIVYASVTQPGKITNVKPTQCGVMVIPVGKVSVYNTPEDVVVDLNPSANIDSYWTCGPEEGTFTSVSTPILNLWALPTTDGSASQVLTTNGSGVLSWSSASVGASDLNDLTDVDTTGASTSDVLTYNGSSWIASAPVGGSGGGLTKTEISASVATLACDSENIVTATDSSSSGALLYAPQNPAVACVINITSASASGFSLLQSTTASASQTIVEDGTTSNSSSVVMTDSLSADSGMLIVSKGANKFVSRLRFGSLIADYLVVGGGGGGAGGVWSNGFGAGGGAGGLAYGTLTISKGAYSVVVGAGGNGGTANGTGGIGAQGADGGASSLGSVASVTGGGGGGRSSNAGNNGGSGGGAGDGSGTPGTGVSGQGYAGGAATGGDSGGGGGGYSSVGANGSANVGGNGGSGYTSNISGTSVCYAGGGGGSGYSTAGTATCGGAGGSNTGGSAPTAATDGTGGGGGGGQATASAGHDGSKGGNGIVIVRYKGQQRATGGTITQSGGYTIHTFTTSGTLTF